MLASLAIMWALTAIPQEVATTSQEEKMVVLLDHYFNSVEDHESILTKLGELPRKLVVARLCATAKLGLSPAVEARLRLAFQVRFDQVKEFLEMRGQAIEEDKQGFVTARIAYVELRYKKRAETALKRLSGSKEDEKFDLDRTCRPE